MRSIETIEKQIMEISAPNDRIIRGLWSVDCFFNPLDNGRVFDYKFLVTQTLGQGCAYSSSFDYNREYLYEFVGCDFSVCKNADMALKVSFLDSLYASFFPVRQKETLQMNADSHSKMKWRTNILKNEAIRLLGELKNKTVVNVGVVGDILYEFNTMGCNVVGTDFDLSIVGKKINGAPIIDGNKTLDILKNADLAIITGMAIVTETIDDIINCCLANKVRTIVFAETGANFSGFYIKNGIDVYLSEYFPFYIFNGLSFIDVCRS